HKATVARGSFSEGGSAAAGPRERRRGGRSPRIALDSRAMAHAHDVRLIRSPLSVAGMVITTITAVLFLIIFLADLFGLHTNPYLGIVFFLVLPSFFLLGLVLIPAGAWIEHRRRAAGKAPSQIAWPRLDLNVPRQRRAAVIIFALTMANIVIVSLAAYRGIEYMDSVQFCGQVCHTVMKP